MTLQPSASQTLCLFSTCFSNKSELPSSSLLPLVWVISVTHFDTFGSFFTLIIPRVFCSVREQTMLLNEAIIIRECFEEVCGQSDFNLKALTAPIGSERCF